jgi:hypothetical protein
MTASHANAEVMDRFLSSGTAPHTLSALPTGQNSKQKFYHFGRVGVLMSPGDQDHQDPQDSVLGIRGSGTRVLPQSALSATASPLHAVTCGVAW